MVRHNNNLMPMRISPSLLATATAAALLATGCGGAERKLGRGLNNMMEFTRLGEFRRSVEQTALFEGPEIGYTTGALRGIGRTFIRTAMGFGEVLTFPVPMPTYDAWTIPAKWLRDPYTRLTPDPFTDASVYPENFRPGLFADQIFATDTAIGFSGGEILPMIPGSRFRVFDH